LVLEKKNGRGEKKKKKKIEYVRLQKTKEKIGDRTLGQGSKEDEMIQRAKG